MNLRYGVLGGGSWGTAIVKILSENVDVKVQIEKLRDELATLETEDLENKLKAFFKKYDPNFNNQDEQEEL